MPYRWMEPAPDKARAHLRLWPHQSLTTTGFAWFIAVTAVLFALPLLAVLGSPMLWILLAFVAAAIAGVWRAIMVNRAHRRLAEDLVLWPDRAWLRHTAPGQDALEWEANPYWVRVGLTAEGGPVENYLTLKGGGREVEVGAFLTPEERLALKDELELALARLRGAG